MCRRTTGAPLKMIKVKLNKKNLDILKIMTEKDIAEKNALFKNREYYKLLFDGEKVEWHSDEEYYDIANRVIIRKVDDNFVLEFIRPEMTEDKCFYFSAPGSIRIHLVPPKKPKIGIPWVIIINGQDIIPLSCSWAILLREFIKEVNKLGESNE